MSPIGRIFVVLNLILSAAFLGWASDSLQTSQDWKNKYADLDQKKSAEIQGLNDELSAKDVENRQLTDAQRTYREERDNARDSIERLTTQLTEEQRRNGKMQEELTTISGTLSDYNDTISQLESAKDRAVEKAHDMEGERDDAVASAADAEQGRRDAEDALGGANQTIAGLEKTRTGLSAEVSRLSTHLQVLVDVTGVRYEDILSQPQIEAAVLDVRTDLPPGLVMLNVGSDDAVRRGYTFEIFDGSTYKGQVRVENVQGSMCSALITRAVAGATIRQGDRASTRL